PCSDSLARTDRREQGRPREHVVNASRSWDPGGMDSLFQLGGRVALVTGGNGGIGLAIARGLQRAGALVAVTGRNSTKNSRARAELGEGALVLEADVTDERAVAHAIAEVVESFGRLD